MATTSDRPDGLAAARAMESRARALLEMSDARIRRSEVIPLAGDGEDEGELLARRVEFGRLLAVVRRIAAGEPVYEHVDGSDYIMRPPCDADDPRMRSIARLAEIIGVDGSELDAKARSLLDEWEREMENIERMAREFMATLPEPRKAPRLRPTAVSREKLINYDGSKLEEIAQLVGDSTREDRPRLEWLLLDDECGPASTDEAPPHGGVRPEARLVAVARALEKVEAELAAAIVRKLRAINSEFPSGGENCEPAYSARSADLDAELLRPLREEKRRLRILLVVEAKPVKPIEDWPPGGSLVARAVSLASSVQATESEISEAAVAMGLVGR